MSAAADRRTRILRLMGEDQAAVMAARATSAWRPGLAAPIDFDVHKVRRLAGLHRDVTDDTITRDLDALVKDGELRRPFQGRRVWRIAR